MFSMLAKTVKWTLLTGPMSLIKVHEAKKALIKDIGPAL